MSGRGLFRILFASRGSSRPRPRAPPIAPIIAIVRETVEAARSRVGRGCRGRDSPRPRCATTPCYSNRRPTSSVTSKLHAPEKTSTFEKIPNAPTCSRCKLAITRYASSGIGNLFVHCCCRLRLRAEFHCCLYMYVLVSTYIF